VNENSDPFGQVINTYTRAQAVTEGLEMDVTRTAREAGIRFPVFLTRAVFDAYVVVPEDVTGQNEAGRLWNIVWTLRFAIRRAAAHRQIQVPFVLHVRNDNRSSKPVTLVATCGAVDTDDSRTAVTVTMPDED
jgi:hypothetical protein